MKRNTKLLGAGIFLAIVLVAIVLLLQSGLVRRSGAGLETLLANNAVGGATGSGSADGPGAEAQWLIDAVRDATGRVLSVEGPFDAYLLPLPGFLLGRATLSNKDSFGEMPFASVDGAELRVGSLSLFDRELRIERMALAGFRLLLERNAAGATNWADFLANRSATAAPGTTTAERDESSWNVGIDSFEVVDAEIGMRDAERGREWTLSGFEFRASDLYPGQFSPLAFSFDFDGNGRALSVSAALRALSDETHVEFAELDLVVSRIEPEALVALLESAQATNDPDALERARRSRSLRLTGRGTVDYRTRAIEFDGGLELGSDWEPEPGRQTDAAAGASLLSIRGTLDRPLIELGRPPRAGDAGASVP